MSGRSRQPSDRHDELDLQNLTPEESARLDAIAAQEFLALLTPQAAKSV